MGLRAKIKHEDCFILYTNSDKDLYQFIYIGVDTYYKNQRRFFNEILPVFEVKEIIKNIKTINIFQFVSLLNFINIYDDFKLFVEQNWDVLDMNNLIEL